MISRPRLSPALAILLALTLGCPSRNGPTGEKGPDDSKESANPESEDEVEMSGSKLQRARQSFGAAIAEAFGKDKDEVEVTPKDEKKFFEDKKYNVGDLLALKAQVGKFEIRGFADGEGAVVSRKTESFAPLFAAAEMLDDESSLPAADIAERLAWMYKHDLVETLGDYRGGSPVPEYVVEPEIERLEDGGGRLHFFTIEAGDTGSFVPHEFIVSVDEGYAQAQVEVKRRPHGAKP